jgi:hypothetical protein
MARRRSNKTLVAKLAVSVVEILALLLAPCIEWKAVIAKLFEALTQLGF